MLWNAVGTVALQGGTFVTNLLVANLLGAERYGQFGFLITTAQTLGAVLCLATGITATKYIAQNRQANPELARASLDLLRRLSSAAGVLGTLGLAALALTTVGDSRLFPGLRTELLISAPVVFCSIVMGFQIGALAGFEGFAKSAPLLALLMVVQVASTAVAAKTYGLTGALLAMTLNLALRTLCCAWLLRKEAARLPRTPNPGQRDFLRRMIVSFMVPAALTGLTTLPALWIASAALTRAPGGYSLLGHFNAAMAVRGAVMIVPWIVSTVGFSLLSAHMGQGKEGAFRSILRANIALSVGAAAIGAGVVGAFSEQVLRYYGEGFEQAASTLRLLMVSLLAESLALPLYQALASRGRMWVSFFLVQLPRDLCIAAVSITFAKEYGPLALAAAHACGWLLTMTSAALLLTVFRGRNSTIRE